ncbi:MAG: hypothetical protein WCA78_04175 [Rhizomicrobium sp.]
MASEPTQNFREVDPRLDRIRRSGKRMPICHGGFFRPLRPHKRRGQIVVKHRLLGALRRRFAKPADCFVDFPALQAQSPKPFHGIDMTAVEFERRPVLQFRFGKAPLPMKHLPGREMLSSRHFVAAVVHDILKAFRSLLARYNTDIATLRRQKTAVSI